MLVDTDGGVIGSALELSAELGGGLGGDDGEVDRGDRARCPQGGAAFAASLCSCSEAVALGADGRTPADRCRPRFVSGGLRDAVASSVAGGSVRYGRRARRSVSLTCLVVVAAVACSSTASPARPLKAQVSVTPARSILDQPLQIDVSGLPAGRPAHIRVTSTDAHGVHWAAQAAYTVDRHGAIDTSRTVATAGSYRGVEGMGLIAAMRPSSSTAAQYFWSRTGPQSFTFSVSTGGKDVGSVTIRRSGVGPGVTFTPTTVPVEGFVGELFSGPRTGHRKPAVVVIGGSEGGLKTVLTAAALASHGYTTLAVAYFAAPSLPAKLQAIPLEYFQRAIAWLSRQSGVDPSRITVMGASRSSEAAILLADHYPASVHAAIDLVPSNVSLGCYPGCTGPAWTFEGKPVPFTNHINEVTPRDAPDAVLPVNDLKGPVLLACAEDDQIWTSCPYADALTKRLDAAAPGVEHRLIHYADTGHTIAILPPYEPGTPQDDGGSPQANRRARDALWPQILTFLERS